MANQLKLAMVNTITTLKRHGWSIRRIAKELGIDRATVRRYVRIEQSYPKPPTNAPIGSATGTDPPVNRPPGQESRCIPYSNIIRDKIDADLTAQRIYQDLVTDHGYRSIFDVVRDFLEDEAFLGQDKVLAKYLIPDLLIIDDMGIKLLPKRSGEYLFEIIMRRYETKSTIMTSNRPLEDWGKLIGDVPSATAILDRFLHHAEIVTITGRSYQLKDRANSDNSDKKKPNKENEKENTNEKSA